MSDNDFLKQLSPEARELLRDALAGKSEGRRRRESDARVRGFMEIFKPLSAMDRAKAIELLVQRFPAAIEATQLRQLATGYRVRGFVEVFARASNHDKAAAVDALAGRFPDAANAVRLRELAAEFRANC